MPGTRKLGRTTAQRTAMLRAMVTFLLEKGKIEGMIQTLSDLVRKGLITLQQASEQAGMTVPEFRSKAGIPT